MSSVSSSSEAVLARLLVETAGNVDLLLHSTAKKLSQSQVNAEGFTLARLGAALLRESAHDAKDNELLAALRTFLFLAVSSDEYTAIADICLQHTPLLEITITAIRDSLFNLITALRPEDFVVPNVAISSPRGSPENATSDFDELNAQKSIFLLRSLFLHSDQCLKNLSSTLFQPLLILAGVTNDKLSQASANALLALISITDAGTPQLVSTAHNEGRVYYADSIRADDIWEWIRSALSSGSAIHRTRAFSLWLRFLVKRSSAFPTQEILVSGVYWKHIMDPLASGTTEQQRLSLSIMNMSLNLCHQDFDCQYMLFKVRSRTNFEEEYQKFAILYQTIVLGRYLNQVEACMPELDSLAQDDSKLHKAWLTTLLKACIGSVVQDSIRKLIGDWIMRKGTGILHGHSALAADFLQTSFLPWAASGPLFNASVTSTSSGITCTHGEGIASFLQEILTAEPAVMKRSLVIKSCLAFLAERTEQVFSFARAYILEGLVRASAPGNNILDDESMVFISKINSAGGVQVVVKDYITILCAKLVLQGHVSGDLHHIALRSLLQSYRQLIDPNALDNRPLSSDSIMLGPRFSKSMTLDAFQSSLRNSQFCCLQGQGLQAACDYLLHSLDTSTARDISITDWPTIFSALWEETEAQDHPRAIIMSLPGLVLHPKCIGLCKVETHLTTTISQILRNLQALYQFRMYAFPPLAHALRRVILSIPEAVCLPLVEILVEFARRPPVLKIEFQLEAAMARKTACDLSHRSYEYHYGKKGSYGYACIFDMLNQMAMPSYLEVARHAVDELLYAWIHQKTPPPMFSHWKTTEQLQVIIILLERIRPFLSDQQIGSYLDTFFIVLAEEPMPRMRYLMEWAIVRMLAYSADSREDLLNILQAQDGSVPKLTASTMKIALMLARLPDTGENFTTELIRQLIPLSASPKIVIRHEAQWTFPALFQVARERKWSTLTDNAAFERLDAHIRNLDTYKKPPPGRLRDHFEVIKDHHLTMLCQGEYLRMEPMEAEKLSKDDFLALFKQDEDYIKKFVSTDGTSLPLGDHKAGKNMWQGPIVDKRRNKGNRQDAGSPSMPLQTKGTAAQDMILQGGQNETRKSSVIVVASLIDNAYNIGGLSRAGEIFGIQSLQIRDLDIVKTKDFASVAVSSENWLEIEELTVENIPTYLAQRKLDGYTVIGIEQTDSSIILGQGNWRFPKHVVLVLGSEKYGIDPRLLAEMDICVEIHQVGKTRSLNVQAAAAVTLFEYNRQFP